MLQKSSLELRLLYVGELIKIRLLYKFYILRFYKLITTIKTIFYCNKACESEINLKHTIFYKYIAILHVIMVAQHHKKVMEQHFLFLHLHKTYNLFKTIYQALNKLNQLLNHTISNDHEIFTTAHIQHQ